jgi:hypothetical protein
VATFGGSTYGGAPYYGGAGHGSDADAAEANPAQSDAAAGGYVPVALADVADANPAQVDTSAGVHFSVYDAAAADSNPLQADSATDVPPWPLKLSDGDTTIAVSVAVGGHVLATVPRAPSTRSYRQQLAQHRSVANHSAAITTTWMDATDTAALEAMLGAPGTLTASGYLVGGTRTVAVLGATVERSDAGLYGAVSFDLMIEDPSA